LVQVTATATLNWDTATNVINYLNANTSGAQIGDVILFTINAGAAVTVGTGTGVTVVASGSGIITGASKVAYVVITNVITPSYTIYI